MDEGAATPLGEPNESYAGLPAAWMAALRICPWCRGDGKLDSGRDCVHCAGSGDLLGFMLKDAYLRGRDHVLYRLREVEDFRRIAAERVREEEPSAHALRVAMGIGRRL